jgi:hypothetical protein
MAMQAQTIQVFFDNKEWFPTEKIFPNKDNMESLMDVRGLGDIAERLKEASSDDLLIAPLVLFQVVEEVRIHPLGDASVGRGLLD